MKLCNEHEEIILAIQHTISSMNDREAAKLERELPISQLGVDSVKIIHVIVQLEKRFGIRFEDDEFILDSDLTIQKLAQSVRSKLDEQ